jgi:hypothetical protein
MLGFIFTELVEFVESAHGEDFVDQWLDSCELKSGGAFTSQADYSHSEMVELVGKLSEMSGAPAPDLLRTFGQHLFGYLQRTHEFVMRSIDNPLDLFENLENHVHVEVRKLYPNAEVPSFETQRLGSDDMVLRYRSSRALPDLAEGLILGAAAHFDRSVRIDREDVSGGSGEAVDFRVRLGPADG